MNKAGLAKEFQVSIRTVDAWVLRGCPYTRTQRGGYRFDPKKVAAWRAETMPIANGTASISLNEARTRKEVALAGLRELEYKVRCKELVSREAVEKEWFTIARTVRDNFQNLPARTAGLVCAERNQQRCYDILASEVQQILEGLTRDA
jgi:phage terminase Nu1 subunit (DNA packaging protein)